MSGAAPSALVALVAHAALAAVAIAVALGLAWAVRARGAPAVPDRVYESGIRPAGTPETGATAPYFLVAALFVIFDMEAAILFAWAVAAREAGWIGLVEAGIFIGVLLAGLVYLWADGAFDFGFRPRGGA